MAKLTDVMTAPWAILPSMLQEIRGIYETHMRGDKIDIAGVEARLGRPLSNEQKDYEVIDGVAVISASGAIAKRMNLFSQISGGISSEILGHQIEAAMNDDDVTAIVLDIDSPGGTVDGTFELADRIYSMRGDKQIVALANGLMASAAYAIGAAADAIYMSGNTTHVGSIGVVAAHTDYSKMEKQAGIKTTEIYAGKYKRIASQYEPLSAEGRENIQEAVDYLYSIFVERVAVFRGVSVDTVLEDMADGKLFIGQQAIDAGLVDGVSSLDNLIAELSSGRLPEKGMSTQSQSAGDAQASDEPDKTKIDDEDHAMQKEILVTAITAAFVQEHCPDVAATLSSEAAAAAGKEAAAAERQRIQGVMNIPHKGHEALINDLAFDGKTTAAEAALQILDTERATREKVKTDTAADASELDKVDASADAGLGGEGDASNLPLEDQCKLKWDKSPSLRAEFGDKFSTYLHFEQGTKEKGGRVLGSVNK